MKIIPSCETCLFEKQKKLSLKIEDEGEREQYLQEIRALLDGRREEDTAPYIVSLFRKVQEKYMGKQVFPASVRREYNELILSLEDRLLERIQGAEDPLEKALVYARIGNYIDFGAMHQVKQEELLRMLDEEAEVHLDREVYDRFCQECEKGKRFLLLCDNCGEIVLDRIFLQQLKKRYPHLELAALVRGEEVLNDAVMEDALQSGLTEAAEVIPNGNGVAGTVWNMLSSEAKKAMERADVILSKGQGNYESLWGFDKPVYYAFLCKCDLFTSKFSVPSLTGMFVREIRQ